MTEKARHAAGGVVFGQSVSRENKRKPWVARRREPVFLAGKPIDHRVCVARVKGVVHRRLEWFVMRRHRPILQTLRNVEPAEPVFVQHERRVPGNCIKTALVSAWSKFRRLFWRKIGNVDTGPFALPLVPPNQFLALAPRLAGRFGARPIIYDTAVARPGEAPAVAKIVLRVPRKRLVNFVRAEDAGVNPAAARGRTVGLQSRKTVNLRTVMRIAIAIETENNAVVPTGVTDPSYNSAVSDRGYRVGVPAINLGQYGFHSWIAQLVFRVPPVQRAQRFVERIVGLFRFRNETQSELMHEPGIGSSIARRIDRFLAPLQKSLRVGECAFFFRVTGRRKKKNFRL